MSNNPIFDSIYTEYAKVAFEKSGATDVKELAKIANKLIENDVSNATDFKKVAFAYQYGQELAKLAFKQKLFKELLLKKLVHYQKDLGKGLKTGFWRSTVPGVKSTTKGGPGTPTEFGRTFIDEFKSKPGAYVPGGDMSEKALRGAGKRLEKQLGALETSYAGEVGAEQALHDIKNVKLSPAHLGKRLGSRILGERGPGKRWATDIEKVRRSEELAKIEKSIYGKESHDIISNIQTGKFIPGKGMKGKKPEIRMKRAEERIRRGEEVLNVQQKELEAAEILKERTGVAEALKTGDTRTARNLSHTSQSHSRKTQGFNAEIQKEMEREVKSGTSKGAATAKVGRKFGVAGGALGALSGYWEEATKKARKGLLK